MSTAAAIPATNPSRDAWRILHVGFTALPIIAGIDKFTHVLTNWDAYLAPQLAGISPLSIAATMRVVGVIEIVAGLIVAFAPRIGAWIVAAWLVGIIVNLLLLGAYFDIALRDFGLLLAAIALARLSVEYSAR